ncbi:MAG: hypothetical protein ACRD68_02505 [Pyrinomonadaceae bacterium]
MKKNTTKRAAAGGQAATDRAVERVLVILEDPTTPDILYDVLSDLITDLSNETQVGIMTPEVTRVLLRKAFPVAQANGPRVMNGTIYTVGAKREGGERR